MFPDTLWSPHKCGCMLPSAPHKTFNAEPPKGAQQIFWVFWWETNTFLLLLFQTAQ